MQKDYGVLLGTVMANFISENIVKISVFSSSSFAYKILVIPPEDMNRSMAMFLVFYLNGISVGNFRQLVNSHCMAS